MDFSELFKHTNISTCQFSPDGLLLATTAKHRVFIRVVETLQVLRVYSCLDSVSRLEWSPDSNFILAAQFKRRVVQVFSQQDPQWTCKIDEGLAGLTHARWSPDSRHVITTTEFNLRLTIWSLYDRSAKYIPRPKFSEKGVCFSNNGLFMCVVQRKDFKDMIGIYHTHTWELVKRFTVETEDLASVSWSPNDAFLCVVDTPLQYKLLVYSTDGRKVLDYAAYDHALGVKVQNWSNGGTLMSVGSFDEVARIFNTMTWHTVTEFDHQPRVEDPTTVIYQEMNVEDDTAGLIGREHLNEPEVGDNTDDGRASELAFRQHLQHIRTKGQAHERATRGLLHTEASRRSVESKGQVFAVAPPSKYALLSVPVEVAALKPDLVKPNPKIGVGLLSWSCDDKYLASRNDSMPCTLWVYDMARLHLVALVNQLDPIRTVRWAPRGHTLAVCTENNKLYLWTPGGVSIVDIPAVDFCVRSLRWNAQATCLVLMDRSNVCCCYLDQAAEQ